MGARQDILYMVIPCYNEEEVLPETSRQLKQVMYGLIEKGKISPKSRVMFVNDGSKDRTWPIGNSIRRIRCLLGCACPGTRGIRTPCWRA